MVRSVFSRRRMKGRVSDAQLLGRLLVAEPLDRDHEALPERRRRPEERRVEDLHDRPQLAQVVLDRGAGERDLAGRRQGADRLGLLGLGVLHVLGLVEHDAPPGHLGQHGPVPGGQGVGGDHDVRGRGQPSRRSPPGPGSAPWCIITDSSGVKRSDSRAQLPATDVGQMTRVGPRSGLAGLCVPGVLRSARQVLVLQEGQHGGRLAQTHVVGQAGAEAEALEHLEPGHARAVGRGGARRRSRRASAGRRGCPPARRATGRRAVLRPRCRASGRRAVRDRRPPPPGAPRRWSWCARPWSWAAATRKRTRRSTSAGRNSIHWPRTLTSGAFSLASRSSSAWSICWSPRAASQSKAQMPSWLSRPPEPAPRDEVDGEEVLSRTPRRA